MSVSVNPAFIPPSFRRRRADGTRWTYCRCGGVLLVWIVAFIIFSFFFVGVAASGIVYGSTAEIPGMGSVLYVLIGFSAVTGIFVIALYLFTVLCGIQCPSYFACLDIDLMSATTKYFVCFPLSFCADLFHAPWGCFCCRCGSMSSTLPRYKVLINKYSLVSHEDTIYEKVHHYTHYSVILTNNRWVKIPLLVNRPKEECDKMVRFLNHFSQPASSSSSLDSSHQGSAGRSVEFVNVLEEDTKIPSPSPIVSPPPTTATKMQLAASDHQSQVIRVSVPPTATQTRNDDALDVPRTRAVAVGSPINKMIAMPGDVIITGSQDGVIRGWSGSLSLSGSLVPDSAAAADPEFSFQAPGEIIVLEKLDEIHFASVCRDVVEVQIWRMQQGEDLEPVRKLRPPEFNFASPPQAIHVPPDVPCIIIVENQSLWCCQNASGDFELTYEFEDGKHQSRIKNVFSSSNNLYSVTETDGVIYRWSLVFPECVGTFSFQGETFCCGCSCDDGQFVACTESGKYALHMHSLDDDDSGKEKPKMEMSDTYMMSRIKIVVEHDPTKKKILIVVDAGKRGDFVALAMGEEDGLRGCTTWKVRFHQKVLGVRKIGNPEDPVYVVWDQRDVVSLVKEMVPKSSYSTDGDFETYHEFPGHTDEITEALVVSNGSCLVTSSLDGTIRLFALPAPPAGTPGPKRNLKKSSRVVYEGERDLRGKKHGFGVCTWSSGSVYTGEWKDGLRHGHGVYAFPSGEQYDGEWIDGKKHGHGVLILSNGKKYDGEWVKGKKHGHGVYTWPEGVKYDGEYVDGKKEGHGVYTWPSGARYDGEWINDKREDSNAWYVHASGVRQRAEYQNDKRIRFL